MTIDALVIGSRGLLGSALTRTGHDREGWIVHETPKIPWGNPQAVAKVVSAEVALLAEAAAARGSSWAVIWAAGAAVTSSEGQAIASELDTFTRCVTAIGQVSTLAVTPGIFFYSSSAGGAYAGSSRPPFDETTKAVPLSPYGELKLAAEAVAADILPGYGVNVGLGRIANLYGPGQKLDKMQGLISHLALAHYSPKPATIYVSLDTIRDYLFVDDCATLIQDLVDELANQATKSSTPITLTKVLASGQGVTIGELLGEFRMIGKRRPNVMVGFSRAAEYQARDLRLRSRVWEHLDARPLTPLPAGIAATMRDILAVIQAGSNGRAR